MIPRLACIAILCAVTMQAAAQAPFDWAISIVYDLRSQPAPEMLPKSGAVLVDGTDPDRAAKLTMRARAAGLHVTVDLRSSDPAAASLFDADGFLVDGIAPNDAPLMASGGLPARIAGTNPQAAGFHAVAVDLPSELDDPDVDWDAAYRRLAASSPPRILRIETLDHPAEHVAALLLAPAGILIDALPDDPVVAAAAAYRLRHPAIGAGTHEQLVNNQYTFWRSLDVGGETDHAVVVVGAAGPTSVNVSRAFADDTLLQDALTGRTAFVSFGMARFDAHESGFILIEELP